MSADPPAYRKRPEDIGGIYVRSEAGQMVPLSALADGEVLPPGRRRWTASTTCRR